MIEFSSYSEHELRSVCEMFEARMRCLAMQSGFSPKDANLVVAETIACGLKLAHSDGLVKGPMPRLRVVGK